MGIIWNGEDDEIRDGFKLQKVIINYLAIINLCRVISCSVVENCV